MKTLSQRFIHEFVLCLPCVSFLGCSKQEAPKPQTASTAAIKKGDNAKPPPPPFAPRPTEDEARIFLTSLPVATVAIGAITNQEAMAMGVRPNPGTIYNLYLTKPVQKVPDGYFLQWAPPGQIEQGELFFLRTDLELREDVLFFSNEYWAVFVGPYRYTTVRGFDHEIYGFTLLNSETDK